MTTQIGLDFAPGTTEDCMRLIRYLPPGDLFDAYRLGRQTYNTSDIVLVVGDRDPSTVEAWPRVKYCERALRRNGKMLSIAHRSAHQVMMLPPDSDAFWLVLELQALPGEPIMCVLHATRSEKHGDQIIATA